jgi:O-antigen ligase
LAISCILLVTAFGFFLFATPFLLLLLLSIPFYLAYLAADPHRPAFRIERPDFLLFAFILSSFVSGILARDKVLGLETIGVFAGYILVMYYFRYYRMDKKQFQSIILAMSIGFIVCCAFALFHFFIFHNVIHLNFLGTKLDIYPSDMDHSSLQSIFAQPLSRTEYLFSVTISILLSFTVYEWRNLKVPAKIIQATALVLSLLVLLLSFSRGGILFVILTSLIILFLYRKFKWFWITAIAIIIAAASFFVLDSRHHFIPLNQTDHKKFTIETRLEQYQDGLCYFREGNWVFGIGLMNFRDRYASNVVIGDRVDFVHNTYLAILIETGISGFLLLFGYFLINTFMAFKNAMKDRKPWKVCSAAVLAGFLVTSFIDAGLLYAVPVSIFMWIVLGLSSNPHFDDLRDPD